MSGATRSVGLMSPSLRVLLPTPDFPPARGGIQLLLHRLAAHAHAVEYRILTSAGGAPVDDAGLDVVRTGRPRHDHRIAVAELNLATLREARRYRPHVILAGHIVAAPGAIATGRPTVLYTYAREVPARPQLTRWTTHQAAATIVISDHGRSVALAAGAPAERLRLVHPGVDPVAPGFERCSEDEPLVVTVGRLQDHHKGFDVLIRSLSHLRERVPDARLVLVGDGPLRDELEALCVSEGVADAATFAGACTDAERDAWLARAAIFAMPGRVSVQDPGGEGFGIVYLEAAARGLPVVAGAEGGATDAVHDGFNGVLVDPRDHVALADTLADLMEDTERRAEMGRAGIAWAARFGWERMAREVETILGEAATGSLRRGSLGRAAAARQRAGRRGR